MKYDMSLAHRCLLGVELRALFDKMDFARIKLGGVYEAVFAREIPNTNMRVMVFSGCDPETTGTGMTARPCGTDAIRVVVVYKGTNGERGIVSTKRVHRIGHIEAIVKRTESRMRDVWQTAANGGRCADCDAPLFKSKRGNPVCADVCWTRRGFDTPADILAKLSTLNPEALLLEPRAVYDAALVGITDTPQDHWPRKASVPVAVYDEVACIEAIQRGMDCDPHMATEWFDFNVSGAWMGEGTPTFRCDDLDNT